MLVSVPGILPTANSGSAGRRSPLLHALAALWLLLWTLLCLTEVANLIHDPRVPHWHPFTIALISTGVLGGWLAWALASRRFERIDTDPPGRWFRYHLRMLPLLIVGCIVLVVSLRQVAYGLMGADYRYLPWRILIPYESAKVVLFYALWLALMFGMLTLAKWREDSERMLGVHKALAQAQLAQLQAQLRPHFLFNALNTVSSLMICLLHTSFGRFVRGDPRAAIIHPDRGFESGRKRWSFRQVESKERCSVSDICG